MSILKLTGVRVDGDAVTCTGSQIATVLRALEARPALAKCDWYAGALDGYGLRIPEFEEFALKPVNSMIDLIEQIAAVPQLLDGIIVAVPLTQEPAIGSGFVSADGPEGRVVANSLVEVHVFDTTWIEIYSDDETLLGALAAKFNNFGQEQETPAQEGGGYLGRAG